MNRLDTVLEQTSTLKDNYNTAKESSEDARGKWLEFDRKIEIRPTRPNVNQAIIDWFADGGELIAHSPERDPYLVKQYGIPFILKIKKGDINVSISFSSRQVFLDSGKFIDTKDSVLKDYKRSRVDYKKRSEKREVPSFLRPNRRPLNKEIRYTIFQIISKFDIDKIKMEECLSYYYYRDITKNRHKSLLTALNKIKKEFTNR